MRHLPLTLSLLVATPSLAQVPTWHRASVSPDVNLISVLDVGDLDGDGDQEFVAAQAGAHTPGGDVKIFRWCDAAGGSFTCHDINQAWWAAQPWDFAGSLRTADLDGDGDLDIAFTGDHHSGVGEGFVYWAENPRFSTLERTGSATEWPIHFVYGFSEGTDHINDMSIADYDQDGKLDIAIRHLDEDGGTTTRRIRILYQDDLSAGTWTLKTIDVAPREGMEAGDLDGDGYPDLWCNGFILENPDGSRTAPWARHDVAPWAYSQPDTGLNNATKNGIADFNRDGHPDLVISRAEGEVGSGSTEGKLAIYLSDGTPFNGGWTEVVLERGWTNAHQAEVGDVDGDGNPDVVTGKAFGSNGIWTWYINADGTLREKRQIEATQGSYTGRLADTDGDGDLDYVAPTAYNGQVYHYEHEGGTPTPIDGGGADREPSPSDGHEFSVYPNPAVGDVTVRHPSHGTITVFDVLGRAVARFDAVGEATALSGLAPGQYVVRYATGDGHARTRVLVVTR